MKILLSILLLTCHFASHAHSHGTPIHVEVLDNRLVASHPLGPAEFAPPIFGESDADGDFYDSVTLPTLGSLILWESPGLEIFAMDSSSNLSIEILARPVVGSNPAEKRVLWYWNPATQSVGPSPSGFHLLGTGMRSLTLLPDDEIASAPFLLADPVAGHTGFHNHGLLFYGLDDDNAAPAGVYGFFARLTSDQYATSDPFLIVFNYLTAYDSMIPASLAIHVAGTLAGDYDLDGDVDGRDFMVWQRLAGSTTRTVADASLNGIVDTADLAVWQAHYGESFGDLSSLSVEQVPEPNSASATLITLATWLLGLRGCIVIRRTSH